MEQTQIFGYDSKLSVGFKLFSVGFIIICYCIGLLMWRFVLWCGKMFLKLGEKFEKKSVDGFI